MTITASDVITHVSLAFGIPAKDILGERKHRKVAWPRQAAYRLIRDFTRKSYPEIGRRFQRDHSTIIHGCRNVPEIIKRYPEFAEKYASARDAISRQVRERRAAYEAKGPAFRMEQPVFHSSRANDHRARSE